MTINVAMGVKTDCDVHVSVDGFAIPVPEDQIELMSPELMGLKTRKKKVPPGRDEAFQIVLPMDHIRSFDHYLKLWQNWNQADTGLADQRDWLSYRDMPG